MPTSAREGAATPEAPPVTIQIDRARSFRHEAGLADPNELLQSIRMLARVLTEVYKRDDEAEIPRAPAKR